MKVETTAFNAKLEAARLEVMVLEIVQGSPGFLRKLKAELEQMLSTGEGWTHVDLIYMAVIELIDAKLERRLQ